MNALITLHQSILLALGLHLVASCSLYQYYVHKLALLREGI